MLSCLWCLVFCFLIWKEVIEISGFLATELWERHPKMLSSVFPASCSRQTFMESAPERLAISTGIAYFTPSLLFKGYINSPRVLEGWDYQLPCKHAWGLCTPQVLSHSGEHIFMFTKLLMWQRSLSKILCTLHHRLPKREFGLGSLSVAQGGKALHYQVQIWYHKPPHFSHRFWPKCIPSTNTS